MVIGIAYYLSQTYDVTRKNTNNPTPSSIFKCLDTSLLIHADLAFDILLLISGFLISRPWYLYFVKMANILEDQESLNVLRHIANSSLINPCVFVQYITLV